MNASLNEYDTVVIGAGVAGLAAGRVLAAAGQRVAIVEARDRIGGRIFTQRTRVPRGIVPIELGAEFIHGLPAETWALVEEAGLATVELRGSQLSLADNHLQKTDASDHAAIGTVAPQEPSSTHYSNSWGPGGGLALAPMRSEHIASDSSRRRLHRRLPSS